VLVSNQRLSVAISQSRTPFIVVAIGEAAAAGESSP